MPLYIINNYVIALKMFKLYDYTNIPYIYSTIQYIV